MKKMIVFLGTGTSESFIVPNYEKDCPHYLKNITVQPMLLAKALSVLSLHHMDELLRKIR